MLADVAFCAKGHRKIHAVIGNTAHLHFETQFIHIIN